MGRGSSKVISGGRALLDRKIKRGEITLTINHDMQKRHMGDGDGERGTFDVSEAELQKIVKEKYGTGRLYISKTGQMKEVIDAGRIVSTYRDGNGGRAKSDSIMVHYSKKRTHCVPARPSGRTPT